MGEVDETDVSWNDSAETVDSLVNYRGFNKMWSFKCLFSWHHMTQKSLQPYLGPCALLSAVDNHLKSK